MVETARGSHRHLRSAHAPLVHRRDERGTRRSGPRPTVFFTLRRPGITYALPHYAANRRLVAVLGVDIELSRAQHLSQEPRDRPARQGAGDRRQGPGDRLSRPTTGSPTPRKARTLPQLDELGDPTADPHLQPAARSRAFGRKLLDFGSQRIIVSSGALKALTGRNWSVLIVAPESDFLGFVTSSGWLALALSGVVFLLMAALAVLMMWRSLQAERRDRAARERHQALEARAQTLAELAAALQPDGPRHRPTACARRPSARRRSARPSGSASGTSPPTAAPWSARTISIRSANAHTAGAELYRDEFPRLFAALEELAEIDAPRRRGAIRAPRSWPRSTCSRSASRACTSRRSIRASGCSAC